MTNDKIREAFKRVEQRMKDALPYRDVWGDEFKVIEDLLNQRQDMEISLDYYKTQFKWAIEKASQQPATVELAFMEKEIVRLTYRVQDLEAELMKPATVEGRGELVERLVSAATAALTHVMHPLNDTLPNLKKALEPFTKRYGQGWSPDDGAQDAYWAKTKRGVEWLDTEEQARSATKTDASGGGVEVKALLRELKNVQFNAQNEGLRQRAKEWLFDNMDRIIAALTHRQNEEN